MMVKDLVQKHFELGAQFSEEIYPKLNEMYVANEITGGALCYVYCLWEEHSYKKLSEMIGKAHTKLSRTGKYDLSQAYNDVAKKWDWEYHVREEEKFLQKCRDLIASERVTCPVCGNVHVVNMPCRVCLQNEQKEAE